ncbi:hypothetical protein ACFL5U_01290 [Candidatus Margulisiibacteriota bacterium]
MIKKIFLVTILAIVLVPTPLLAQEYAMKVLLEARLGTGQGEFFLGEPIAPSFLGSRNEQLFFLDPGNKRLQKFDNTGQYVASIKLDKLYHDAALDAKGFICLFDVYSQEILKMDIQGQIETKYLIPWKTRGYLKVGANGDIVTKNTNMYGEDVWLIYEPADLIRTRADGKIYVNWVKKSEARCEWDYYLLEDYGGLRAVEYENKTKSGRPVKTEYDSREVAVYSADGQLLSTITIDAPMGLAGAGVQFLENHSSDNLFFWVEKKTTDWVEYKTKSGESLGSRNIGEFIYKYSPEGKLLAKINVSKDLRKLSDGELSYNCYTDLMIDESDNIYLFVLFGSYYNPADPDNRLRLIKWESIDS